MAPRLTASRRRPDAVVVTLLTPDAPRHVLLAELERPWPGGAATVDAVTIGVVEAQRERGDLAVESPGTTVVTESTAERADRVDVREMGAGVRALARWPLLAAYRYQRASGGAGPRVALGVARFADAEVAPAIVSAAAATTLITTDGRALTEVRLQLENERQPFVRVGLPAGGRIVSVTLDEEAAKPVTGADGLRLPLLHAERGGAARELRYVYLHDGTPFVRKGEVQMLLPTMDLPIGVVHWEVFVPDDIRARRVEGTAVDAGRFDDRRRPAPWMPVGTAGAMPLHQPPRIRISALQGGPAGQVRGRATEVCGRAAARGDGDAAQRIRTSPGSSPTSAATTSSPACRRAACRSRPPLPVSRPVSSASTSTDSRWPWTSSSPSATSRRR